MILLESERPKAGRTVLISRREEPFWIASHPCIWSRSRMITSS